MNVPGPEDHLHRASSRPGARTARRARRAARALGGTLPDRQPSSPSSRPRSEVSTSRGSVLADEDVDASSPKRSCRRSVACQLAVPRPTSVSVPVVGSRRSASSRAGHGEDADDEPTRTRPPRGGPHERPQDPRQPHARSLSRQRAVAPDGAQPPRAPRAPRRARGGRPRTGSSSPRGSDDGPAPGAARRRRARSWRFSRSCGMFVAPARRRRRERRLLACSGGWAMSAASGGRPVLLSAAHSDRDERGSAGVIAGRRVG